ncbi:hypothetical protein SCOCK_250039 [Actinacidiphila cocklensis]|uniref:Uncharacterized protein n=1 Tax=Actinacidiphila cocklensis TaxID=887465 RepID=A0A9W4DML8_9ACTN|nr:hypothetical protein SCOCK_250039 [Actinacidiphila cocklensis]
MSAPVSGPPESPRRPAGTAPVSCESHQVFAVPARPPLGCDAVRYHPRTCAQHCYAPETVGGGSCASIC